MEKHVFVCNLISVCRKLQLREPVGAKTLSHVVRKPWFYGIVQRSRYCWKKTIMYGDGSSMLWRRLPPARAGYLKPTAKMIQLNTGQSLFSKVRDAGQQQRAILEENMLKAAKDWFICQQDKSPEHATTATTERFNQSKLTCDNDPVKVREWIQLHAKLLGFHFQKILNSTSFSLLRNYAWCLFITLNPIETTFKLQLSCNLKNVSELKCFCRAEAFNKNGRLWALHNSCNMQHTTF